MSLRRYLLPITAALVIAFVPMCAYSQADAHDTAELHAFVLTDAGLHNFIPAFHEIRDYEDTHPDASKGDTEGATIDNEVANLNRHPAKAAILAKNNISARDFAKYMTLVMTGSMYVSASAAARNGGEHYPDFLSAANVAFMRAHPDAMKQMLNK
jgi:hypothetical protein